MTDGIVHGAAGGLTVGDSQPNDRPVRLLRRTTRIGGRLLAIPVALVFIFPVFWMALSSFKSQREAFTVPPTYLPETPSIQAFASVLRDTDFLVYVRNSSIVGVVTTALVLCLSTMAVFSLSRVRVPGAEFLARSTLVFYAMPPILLVVPVVQVFLTIGLVDSITSLIVAYTALYLPLGVWLLRGYFSGLDPAPEEAALLDGLSQFRAFARIGLRQALPGLAIVAFFTFNATWNEYLYASLLIQSNENLTMSAGLSTFIGAIAIYSWPMLMAAGIMAVLPIFLFYLLIERRARRAIL